MTVCRSSAWYHHCSHLGLGTLVLAIGSMAVTVAAMYLIKKWK
jgi:hypothetical protein